MTQKQFTSETPVNIIYRSNDLFDNDVVPVLVDGLRKAGKDPKTFVFPRESSVEQIDKEIYGKGDSYREKARDYKRMFLDEITIVDETIIKVRCLQDHRRGMLDSLAAQAVNSTLGLKEVGSDDNSMEDLKLGLDTLVRRVRSKPKHAYICPSSIGDHLPMLQRESRTEDNIASTICDWFNDMGIDAQTLTKIPEKKYEELTWIVYDRHAPYNKMNNVNVQRLHRIYDPNLRLVKLPLGNAFFDLVTDIEIADYEIDRFRQELKKAVETEISALLSYK